MTDIFLNAQKGAVLTQHLVPPKPVVLVQNDATSKAQNRKQKKEV